MILTQVFKKKKVVLFNEREKNTGNFMLQWSRSLSVEIYSRFTNGYDTFSVTNVIFKVFWIYLQHFIKLVLIHTLRNADMMAKKIIRKMWSSL